MQVLNSFHTTVEKALSEIDRYWRNLDGLIICGTHTPTNIEQMLILIREAREDGRPFLGICAGYQLAWIEYCRGVLGIADATSEEFGEEGTLVVKRRPAIKVGLHDGETWWSNYECVFPQDKEEAWQKPENFFVVPFHPEYGSSIDKPHPFLVSFLNYAKTHGHRN